MFYSQEQILDIKKQLSVKEFYAHFIGTGIEEYGNEYRTICPFHDDHSPSFVIHKEKGLWRCWVDGIGGDYIDFVEQFYGVNFKEAIDIILREFNIEIELSEEDKKRQAIYNGLCKIHSITNTKYQKDLLRSKEAIQYIRERKFDKDTINKFKIGFINGESVCNNEKLYPLYEVGGLLNQNKENLSYYNTFSKNRISIPFQDQYGSVIGFTARTIVGDKLKYLHTKTTPIFKKEEFLYAFNHAKKSIDETKSVFIVEGNLDCIRAHQFGITNCVAISGTAMSDKQINLLKGICKNYYIILEDNVMERLPKNGKETPLEKIYNTIKSNNSWANVKIIKLYDNVGDKCDLDDFLLSRGKGSFLDKIKHAPTYYMYKLVYELNNINYKHIEEKKLYIYKIKKIINSINGDDRRQYIRELAVKLEMPESDIINILSRHNKYNEYEMTEQYDKPEIACQKIIIASLFSKFGYYNAYKILNDLMVDNVLDDTFKKIYYTIKDIVLTNGAECDIINIIHCMDLSSEEKLIVDDCFFKSEDLNYLDFEHIPDNEDKLYELKELLKDKIGDLK